MGRLRRGLGLTALALLAPVLLAPAAHADPVQPYQQNDYGNGGFHDILPPGQCRNVTASEILADEDGIEQLIERLEEIDEETGWDA